MTKATQSPRVLESVMVAEAAGWHGAYCGRLSPHPEQQAEEALQGSVNSQSLFSVTYLLQQD